MLTTSPARSARHSSSRIVRTSTRTLSPSRDISPDAGLTHHAPIRRRFEPGRSMRDRLSRFARAHSYTRRHFRTIQDVSGRDQDLWGLASVSCE